MNAESERGRRARKMADALQAFRLLCKQLDHHATELQETCEEELRAEGADRVAEKVLGETPRLDEKAAPNAPH